jgi:hypothetical protein
MKRYNFNYETGYIKCPTGIYKLVGTFPLYMNDQLYKNEETAKEAVLEAKQVLTSGVVPNNSKFAHAYKNNIEII